MKKKHLVTLVRIIKDNLYAEKQIGKVKMLWKQYLN